MCVCVRVCMHNYVGNENQLENNTLVMVGEGSKGVRGKIYNIKEALTFNTNVPTHFSSLTSTEDVCLPTTS